VDGWLPTTLLGRLPQPAGDAFVLTGQERAFPAGTTLMSQGDHGDYVLLLLSGIVKVTVHSADGQDTLMGVRAGGETVGEMAAFEHEPRMATVKSCRDVQARRIDRPQLDKLMLAYPVIAVELTRMMSARLRWSDDRRVDFGSCGARQRLCRILVTLPHRRVNGSRLVLDYLTQQEIGSLVGIKQRTAEKQFAQLQSDGLIDCRYRKIEILDMPGLRDIAFGR
jgi:CRP/FNR family transcriptional regulator, cyclic AMP receptor protein